MADPMSDPFNKPVSSHHLRADIKKLCEDHWRTGYSEDDRKVLTETHSMLRTTAVTTSFLGLVLGLYGAHRLRARRTAMFQAFRAYERPSHVVFPSGKTGTRYSCTLYLLRSEGLFLDYLLMVKLHNRADPRPELHRQAHQP